MTSLETARETLAGRVASLPAVQIDLQAAMGLRLADAVAARVDLPASDVSVMDGFACRVDDLGPGRALPVAFEVPAGRVPKPLPGGAVARIFTGAVIPQGADTVVPQEQADQRGSGQVLLSPLARGSFIRRQGELCGVGVLLAERGDALTPQRAALLAAAGVSTVRVTRRPRLALLSTGSELVAVADEPACGQIRDSNGLMLEGLAAGAGLDVVLVERVADDAAALRAALRRAAHAADLVVTTGGVSVGDYDLVPAAMAEQGAKILFHRVAIKPGKPLLAAVSDGTWWIGLPGNPLSAFVCWRMFVLPVARALAGDTTAFTESPERATLESPARNHGQRLMLAPAILAGGCVAVVPGKGSHDLISLASANALAVLASGADLASGEPVDCYRL